MTTKRFNIHSDEDNETIWISDVQTHKEIEIQHYYGIATVVKMLNDLAEENEVCKEAYNEIKSDAIHLKEENEHITQTIKDMINTERTELGKMTLRHLWRQIQ